MSKSVSPSSAIDVQNGATWRSRTVSMQPALPIVHVDGRLVGRSIVLSPLVGPLEFGSLEDLKFISDLPPLVERQSSTRQIIRANTDCCRKRLRP